MDSTIGTLLGSRSLGRSSEDEIAEHVTRICAEISQHIAAPSGQSNEAMDDAATALHFAATRIATPELIRGLLEIAEFCYGADRTLAGLTSAADAVRVARKLSEGELLRKSLNFYGNLMADTGNLPRAIECFAEALELSIAAGDRWTEAKVWNNIGVVLLYAAQYSEAIACFERAIGLGETYDGAVPIVQVGYSNIALACLHLEDYGKGMQAVVHATANAAEPTSPTAMFHRVLAESHFARLLLAVGSVDKAKQRCETCERLAAKSGIERAKLIAATAEGLYEVHAKRAEAGLSRLQLTVEKARESSKGVLRDALITIIKALELAGKPDLALVYQRELMMHTRKVQQESALFHHRRHLELLNQEAAAHRAPDAGVLLKQREQSLRDKLAKQVAGQELMRSRIEMLERLAVTAELRDDATGEHAYRVGRLASLLAREYGCDEQTCFMIDLAARLHDIGKIGIPDSILLTKRRLNHAERQLIQTHAIAGAELLGQSHMAHLQMAEDIAKSHHEHWDGSGYPSGLSGTAIPLAARITALADVFDALTHPRPYREAWPIDRALAEIARLKGVQFDPHLADLFLVLVPRLRTKVHDLDEYLAEAARQSPFIRARERIIGTLRTFQADQPPT